MARPVRVQSVDQTEDGEVENADQSPPASITIRPIRRTTAPTTTITPARRIQNTTQRTSRALPRRTPAAKDDGTDSHEGSADAGDTAERSEAFGCVHR